jgi:hypothetical protein
MVQPALVEDYRNPVFRAQARAVLSNFLLQNKKLPFTVGLDGSIIHLKPWSSIVFNPRAKGAWKAVLERYYESDPYKILNNTVAGDPLLSKYATVAWLNTLFKRAESEASRLRITPKNGDSVQALLEGLDTQVSPAEASRAVVRLAEALEAEAREIQRDLEAAESFSHVGVPVAELLERPDEFRRKARNEVVVHLVRFLRRLRRESSSPRQAKVPALTGGRPLGVKRLQRWSELSSLLPTELLDDDLLAYRLASRGALVRERYGGIPDYVVYLDKSGSMAGGIPYRSGPTQVEMVPKISFAAASALALAHRLRASGAKMTLKLFDTEVHDPIIGLPQLIDTLLRVEADSGTNLTRVLEDALNFRDDKIIIVSDGIDEVEEEAVKRAKAGNLDLHLVFIKTDNKLLRQSFPSTHLEEARPEVLLAI